jgi:hypothetical protein
LYGNPLIAFVKTETMKTTRATVIDLRVLSHVAIIIRIGRVLVDWWWW